MFFDHLLLSTRGMLRSKVPEVRVVLITPWPATRSTPTARH
jgi:hypothetical protein